MSMRKTKHKYPNLGRRRKRALAFGLAALAGLLVLGLALQNVRRAPVMDDAAATALDTLAASIASKTGPGTDGGTPEREGAGRGASAPAQEQAAPSPAEGGGAAAGRGAPGSGAPQASARQQPFAGKSLAAISAELSKRYAGKKPALWGERLPGVTTRLDPPPGGGTRAGGPVVALTLDACGGKKGADYDAGLIAFLRERRIPATLFVTSIWLRNNPALVKELAADPLFELAAHGARHLPCSVDGKSVYGIKGTASPAGLVAEVEGNARDLEAATGKRPRWFRSGTAYYDDVAVSLIRDLGLGIAGYSIAGDEGATLPAVRVAAKVLAAKDGDILLLHMNRPKSGTREGLEQALPQLQKRGVRFVPLSDGR